MTTTPTPPSTSTARGASTPRAGSIGRIVLAVLIAASLALAGCGRGPAEVDADTTASAPVADDHEQDMDDARDEDDSRDEDDANDEPVPIDPDDEGSGSPERPANPASEPSTRESVASPATTPVKGRDAKPGGAPAASPTATPQPPRAPIADGTFDARLVRIDRSTVTLDLVRILSGQEAIAAAQADGHPLEDGALPNDVYVVDLGTRVTVPVAGDGGFQIYDCQAGCQLVGTTLDALASGASVPYGGAHAHVTVRVDHGQVVSLVEVYLP
jgi:predicted small lipoprotein YifL